MPYPPDWLILSTNSSRPHQIRVLTEREGVREEAVPQLIQTVLRHYGDLDRLSRLGQQRLVEAMKARLPDRIRIRSGDLGEILASEYIEGETAYRIPVRRLRWKDGREVSMRGDDLIAVRHEEADYTLLKGETKSRARAATAAVTEALEQLDRESGRPQAHSMAFIADRLDEMGREEEALFFYDLLTDGVRDDELEHFVFVFSGNDPVALFTAVGDRAHPLHLVGLYLDDHQAFIRQIFDECHEYLG